MHTRLYISIFLTVLLAAIGCAQDTGSLYGTVVDPGAGVVPNAQVTATSAERGNSRIATSNQSGQWVLTLMPIGTYTIRIEAPGFKAFDRQGVSVGAEENVKIDSKLEVGSTNETITITAEAPLVDSRSSTLGATIGTK